MEKGQIYKGRENCYKAGVLFEIVGFKKKYIEDGLPTTMKKRYINNVVFRPVDIKDSKRENFLIILPESQVEKYFRLV